MPRSRQYGFLLLALLTVTGCAIGMQASDSAVAPLSSSASPDLAAKPALAVPPEAAPELQVVAESASAAEAGQPAKPRQPAKPAVPLGAGARAHMCSNSLQEVVDAAAPRSVVSVPACLYRGTVTIDKPLTLEAQPGAEIRGSDVWVQWVRSGSVWISAGVPPFRSHGNCRPKTEQCLWPEQVFLDGVPLDQVKANPKRGQFAVDAKRNVVLADNPTNRTIEVSTRTRWVVTKSDGVTIRGFTMRHAANDAQTGPIGNDGHSDWTLEGNALSDAHGNVVALNGGTRVRVLDNDVRRAGQLGVGGSGVRSQTSDWLIRGNTIHDNNTEDFDPVWEAGGLKLAVVTQVTIDGNEVHHNDGPGLWCDINCQNITFSSNRVHHNEQAGIFFEISRGARIVGNAIWENGWGIRDWGWGAGILISSSADAEIYGNIVAWNEDGISVVSQDRRQYAHTGVFVHENAITTGRADSIALGWYQDWSGVLYNGASNNRGIDNFYWYPSGEDANNDRFEWEHGGLKALAQFLATPGGTRGRYLSAAEKDGLLAGRGMPPAPEPR